MEGVATPTEAPLNNGLSKNERLCNYSLKQLLFTKGKHFSVNPIKVFWITLDSDLEKIFFSKSLTFFQGHPPNDMMGVQNPSFPFRKVPANALFYHPAKCLMGVSGKAHPRACDRNMLKRYIREAYRQNKHPFYSFLKHKNLLCLLGLIYTSRQRHTYSQIEKKIIVSLQKIQQEITLQYPT